MGNEKKKIDINIFKNLKTILDTRSLDSELTKTKELVNKLLKETQNKSKKLDDKRREADIEARKKEMEQKQAEEKAKQELQSKQAEVKEEVKDQEQPKVETPVIVAEEVKPQAKKEEAKVEPKKEEVKTEEVKVESKKEEPKNQEAKKDEKPEEKADTPSNTENKPVIVKTDNPNIVIINGKRVFVPNARREQPAQRDNNSNGERKTFTRDNRDPNGQRKPFDKNKQFNNKDKDGNFKKPGTTADNKDNKQKKQFNIDAPSFVPQPNSRQDKKKNANKDKGSFEEKKAVNKKALAKGQRALDDYNEDMTGYRKVRKVKEKKQETQTVVKIERTVITKEIIPIKELSEQIGVQAAEITKMLFKEGIMKTINDSIDFDTAGFIAASLGIELELKLDKTAEDVLSEEFKDEADDDAKLIKRSPIVTVMGHVDHGKTSLLDRIRHTNVTEGEAGGITQHIGAYTVNVSGQQITFLDTPGHAAFTAMRARGAQLTDIAIIVVAADDGIMPQTIEAIHHAKAAGVTIIVAANKMDKPTADIERVKKELADQEVIIEEWGGDVAFVPVSAKTGAGIDDLLETILLTADMKELKANPDRMAKGVIVEAKLDKGKGPMATVLVQNGTLKVGDYLVAGTITGKVRAMMDDKGRNIKTAGPSTPVVVLGLESVPNAGDSIFAVEEAKLSSLVAEERKNKEKEEMIRNQQKVSLDELFSKVSSGDLKVLNVIVKADVQGSVEAVKGSLTELSNDEVKVNVLHAAVGAISETDVSLADSSNSIIIGFNVRPDSKAKDLAERSKVDIKLYRIIYEAIDDITKALKGMLAPKLEDVYQGKAEVRDTFKISGVGMVAGCYVTEGKILRSGKLRIYRDDVMICEGNVLQLKRFKDDVKEVAQGFECGISIEKFDGIKVGDFIECYTIEEKKA